MIISTLIKELKENKQDFEFYPTSKNMIKSIFIRHSTNCRKNEWLDIGCGTCNFKKYYNELAIEHNRDKIDNYYVIEKSTILLNKLDKDTITLGTDFYNCLLIDKPIDNIFCNPPYSDFEKWATRIIQEAHAQFIYLVIPTRWKENKAIKTALEKSNSTATVLDTFNFLNAERQARAIVDVIEVKRNRFDKQDTYNNTAFTEWFNNTYKMGENKKNTFQSENQEKQEIHEKLARTDVSKAKMLVDLYNAEVEKYAEHFKAICSLDVDILDTINVKKYAIQEALKLKALGTKAKYWEITFNELDEITSRLTSETRAKMLNKFAMIKKVDFTIENIYPMLLWVLKNANSYYNTQLLSFFKNLTAPDNVKPYKSNQKVFERSQYRHNAFKDPEKISYYTLDYRIIMSSPFQAHWLNGNLNTDNYALQKAIETLKNISIIAKNLGFEVGEIKTPQDFREKAQILYKDSKNVFMEYIVYKNGNMHVKFDMEFMKALNVECSRLLGWIQKPEDIKKEFCTEMAKNAEKYFKQNYTCLTNSMPLLAIKPTYTTTNEQEISINKPYTECLKDVLNKIDFVNGIIEHKSELLEKCLNILKTQNGFVYRNCLINKSDNKTIITFKENVDYTRFLKEVI